MTVDDQQRLWRIVAGGGGIFYAIRADGTVQWWYHTGWQTGAFSWANGASARDIGGGFHDFVEVLGSTDGTLWGIYANGDVMRFRYVCTDLATGAGSWENNGTGVKIGNVSQFVRWFGGPDGVLWCVDAGGDLYRSVYANGALSTPVKVGGGFNDCKWLAADSGGVIYGVRMSELYWFRYTGTGWANNGMPIRIGGGTFDDRSATFLCAAGTGLLYSVDPSRDLNVSAGDLAWMRLANYQTVDTGGAQWSNSGNKKIIGSGFTVEQDAPLQGYAWPPSQVPGQVVGICASTTFPSLAAMVMRHDEAIGPGRVQAAQAISGRFQSLPSGFEVNGCGWQSLFNVTVSASWPSGVYSVKLTDTGHGRYKHIPFIVKPATPTAPIAVILPTLTYAAYNSWGGHNAYINCPTSAPVPLTLQRPSRTTTVEPGGRLDFELYSDVLLLRWLNGKGFTYDVYVDQDLQANPALLTAYKAVVLGSHPEYFTSTMRQSLVNYVGAGGRLVYTGGNGIYESCTLSADLKQGTWRRPDGSRALLRDQGLPESQILGVAYNANGWATNAPYKVLNSHPILGGTGLTVGSLFGTGGYNHAASGWEFDMIGSLAGSATPAQVIARGTNTATDGADMVWMNTASGGFVFSASSLTFNGCLGTDTALSQVFANVMSRAVA
ncbi:N,N-dimethylformamidase beta subunit family domain-containing protein [Dactylosporangium sp. NPDC051484]|uniref:N,N-dimethylformamidase beta subunit family domain-containing protein n=1 Tax=Dactylosporangium sp. NPDC051484 TaxID=3154942 RepID=UPI00344B739C